MKSELRKKYLTIRNSLQKAVREEKSKRIFQKLIEDTHYKNAKKIFVYKSIGSEVITDNIITHSLWQGKQVAIPFLIKEKKEMIFAEINAETKFVKNEFHIQEPEFVNEVQSDKNTLIIVPALVFDSNYFRIGYGGGYYDKYLQNAETLCKIGICYREQLINEIQINQFDKAMDFVIAF